MLLCQLLSSPLLMWQSSMVDMFALYPSCSPIPSHLCPSRNHGLLPVSSFSIAAVEAPLRHCSCNSSLEQHSPCLVDHSQHELVRGREHVEVAGFILAQLKRSAGRPRRTALDLAVVVAVSQEPPTMRSFLVISCTFLWCCRPGLGSRQLLDRCATVEQLYGMAASAKTTAAARVLGSV